VAQSGQTPASPYTNGWESAASNIQDAVSVISDGTTLLVSNGVYTLSSPITVNNFTLKSYNNGVVDPAGIVVRGNYPNTTNRVFTMSHANAVVEGFTITNGYVWAAACYPISTALGTYGGGVYMTAGTLRNCLVTGNTATNGQGGGVYASGSSCMITNCRIIGNAALFNNGAEVGAGGGGGLRLASGAQVWNSDITYNRSPIYCSVGGAVFCSGSGVLLANCNIISNTTADGWTCGGVWMGGSGNTLRNCLITGHNGGRNSSFATGVGANGGLTTFIENCTVVTNYGRGIGPWNTAAGNGTTYRIANTIAYFNTGGDMYGGPSGAVIASNSCVAVTNGIDNFYAQGNITNDPRFASSAASNYRLKHTSPCINTGTTLDWTLGAVDLDGNGRVSPLTGGTVDMGAYEYPIQSGTSFILR
jgi:parallel beta-helix repeat protein